MGHQASDRPTLALAEASTAPSTDPHLLPQHTRSLPHPTAIVRAQKPIRRQFRPCRGSLSLAAGEPPPRQGKAFSHRALQRRRTARRPNQPHLRIQNNVNRDVFQQITHASLVVKGIQKCIRRHQGQVFGRNAPRNV